MNITNLRKRVSKSKLDLEDPILSNLCSNSIPPTLFRHLRTSSRTCFQCSSPPSSVTPAPPIPTLPQRVPTQTRSATYPSFVDSSLLSHTLSDYPSSTKLNSPGYSKPSLPFTRTHLRPFSAPNSGRISNKNRRQQTRVC